MTGASLLLAMWLAVDAGAADGGAPPDPKKTGVVAKQWQAQRTPSGGLAASIGTCSLGCLRGAAALPPSGPGYETMRRSRNRYFGHPDLVAYVGKLAAAAKQAKLGLLLVGDLSQPRGGPAPSGHRSHQTGLDVDLGFAAPPGVRAGRMSARERERISPRIVVELATHKPTPAWGPRVVDLLALAASDPGVDRIFVNPAIKRWLCEGPTAKAAWQSRVRPWWGHHDHFHVRLRCPSESALCVPQDPAKDDGCGASLAWWFSDDAETVRTKKKQTEAVESEPELPAACGDVLGRGATTSAR